MVCCVYIIICLQVVLISYFISSMIHIIRNMLFRIHIFFQDFVVDFYSHIIMVGKDDWYNFSRLKFTKICFLAQHMIFPCDNRECSKCTWKEGVFCCLGKECSARAIKSIQSVVKANVSLLIFGLDGMSIDISRV